MQIHVSGHDVSVVEEFYFWGLHADSPPDQCPVAYKSVTRKTNIAKDGVVYESEQTDDKPAITSQRILKGPEHMTGIGISSVPAPGTPGLQLGGTDTIAGQACQRVSTLAMAGGAVTTFCVFVVPRTCFPSHYVQPLERRTVTPDGMVTVLGRTTELRTGKIGEILQKNAITAP